MQQIKYLQKGDVMEYTENPLVGCIRGYWEVR